MMDEILDKLNSLDKEVYGDFKFAGEFIGKSGSHPDGLSIFYDTTQYKKLMIKKERFDVETIFNDPPHKKK